jgi:hypothetical protein
MSTGFNSSSPMKSMIALIAYDGMKTSLYRIKPGDSKELDYFWYSVQSFLVAVANISNIVRPSASHGSVLPPETLSRKTTLANLLDIDKISILESKEFRNHFEHYDERIEEWANKTTDSIIVDSNVVPSYMIAGYSKIARMRNFDPDTFELTFKDKSYKFSQVVNAIRKLLEDSQAAASRRSS